MSDKKVLIADDSSVMRMMIRKVLTKEGYEVVAEAEDGTKAVELFKEHRPDLVTMDIVMPNQHGIEALKQIITLDPGANIIVISGLHQKSLVMEALDAGAKDFVIKPFDEQELIETLRKHLG